MVILRGLVNMELNLVLQIACLVLVCVCGSVSVQLHGKKTFYDGIKSPEDDPGEPLNLTPYLREGQLDQVSEIASEAYIYFLPVLRNLALLYLGAIWPHNGKYIHMNIFNRSTELVNWTGTELTNNTDPSVDVLYSQAWLDLKNPIVLNVPEFPKKRYFGLLIADAYILPIKMISPRTRGGSLAAEQYVMVGPGFKGQLPNHFDDDHIIRSLSRFVVLIGRTQVFGLDDLPDARAVQSGYTLATLDGNRLPRAHVPVFPFVDGNEISKPIPEAQVFFSYANFIINYFKIGDYESDLFKRFAKIEVGPSQEFIGQKMHQQMYEAIRNGIANGSKKVDDVLAGISEIIVRGWSIRYRPEPVRSDYHSRAVYARISAYPNVPQEETLHLHGWQDTDGDLLGSTKHNYTLTFSPGEFPKVMEAYSGFWSITVYLKSGLDLANLVHNPIDRYAISSNSAGVVYGTNGALTLYLQNKRPDTDAKAANWLPTPDPDFGGYDTGDFHVHMRVYQSRDISVPYYPPGIMKATC